MPNAAGEARLRRMERWLVIFAFGAGLLFAILLAALKWPDYWVYIASEQTPMTWMQSVIWFGSVLLALLCCMLEYARRGLSRDAGLWLLLAAAFAFLMADERFAFHERIRDKLLKPTGFRLLPWMEAGDFILLIYAVIALCAAVFVIRLFRVRRGALAWLIVAAALFAVAVGMDTFDVARMTKDGERLEQSLEEIVELFAATALLCSVFLMLGHYMRALALHRDQPDYEDRP